MSLFPVISLKRNVMPGYGSSSPPHIVQYLEQRKSKEEQMHWNESIQ